MNWTLKIEELIFKLPTKYKTLRNITALEKLISNLERIPIEEIEKLNERYGV